MNADNQYFREFKGSVESAWARKIVNEFYTQERTVEAQLGKTLAVPNFAFSFSKEYLGLWSAKDKTITISHHLLRNYGWNDIVQVLKHEMAHMIVSEIWGDIDNSGQKHGELFAKAANIMGVPASSKLQSTDSMLRREKMVARIHKLFALSESNHHEEAESALNKAYDLMARYNIKVLDDPEERKFVFRPVGEIYGRVPLYVKILARIISKNYFVKHILMGHGASYSNYHREIKRYIEIFGEPHNVDIAEYVFHFLLSEGERQWRDFQETEEYRLRRNGQYSKAAFMEGFFHGFGSTLNTKRVEVMKEVDPGNTLPIGTNDPLLEEKYNGHYNPRTMAGSNGSRGGGRGVGLDRGKNVRIRQGVSGTGGGVRLIGQ